MDGEDVFTDPSDPPQGLVHYHQDQPTGETAQVRGRGRAERGAQEQEDEQGGRDAGRDPLLSVDGETSGERLVDSAFTGFEEM